MPELIDGIDFVSGDLFSFQQANRMKNNWYSGATAPSDPTNGMIWAKNDGTVYIYFDSTWIHFYNKYAKLGFQNTIPNSGFGFWSHSGLASQATGAQADYELAAADYNEDAEGADDSGNWAKVDCTMAKTNDPGNGAGGSDNYYTITEVAATQRISRALSGLTIGKLYKVSVFIENGTGTWADAVLRVMDNALANTIESTVLATEGAWADYSVIFKATEVNNKIVLDLALGGGETAKIDNIRVVEVGPGCFAADDKGPDWWTKTSTLDLLRIHADATHCKGLYGVKIIKGADGAEYLNAFGRIYNKEIHYREYRGRPVTLGCWVYSVSAADNVKLQINDSNGTTESAFIPADTLTWIEITRTCGTDITSFTPRILFDGDTADVAYISRPILVRGTGIGEGNYQPIPEELIYAEKFIPSNKYDNTTGLSTTAYALLELEADSNGKIPKGARAILVHLEALDTGSAAAVDLHIHLRADSTVSRYLTLCFGGRLNSVQAHMGGRQPCSADGNVEVGIQASGAGALSITRFRFLGVQVT